ncbi:integrase [Mycobacterium sp. 852002-50816_SCH5313054-b]|uniref:tyrosine-type recombinase/integrase n=1 Tax=Mycobacterium sp. 852002-50816_SCH5313054-b TaxID=1834092 RepID=UPI0007FE9C3B|nr:site-specific integrase [Mycobacterium sp. 852002-50816_SCH5313054-b]OBF58740.1 integrase [Mycobacterium sp. 852002-50816_SCH5313054-b]
MAARAKRGFATVVHEKSGRYSVRFTAPGGIRMSAGKTFPRKADAEAWAADKRREIDKGAKAQYERVLFSDYAKDWLEHRQVNGRPIKPRTREHYQSILDEHLVPEFGKKQLAAIAAKDVRDWYADTLTDKPTMRSHAYSLLRTILGSAERDEYISKNPCSIVGAGSAKRAKKIRPATVEELAVLTDEMPERLKLMVLLSSWCALRVGEVIELRRGDIDLDDEVIRVRRAAIRVKKDGHYRFEVTTPKSDAGVRDVDIPPNIIPAIETHLAKHVAKPQGSLLFPNATDGHLQPSTVMRHFYAARAKAKRTDLRWHDLRHTGGTMAAVTGATLAELMQRLGHSTPQAALRYQHATRSRGKEIAALLSKLDAK